MRGAWGWSLFGVIWGLAVAGVAFYVWKRLKYGHAVWHGFVLAGSILPFFAVWIHVLPTS